VQYLVELNTVLSSKKTLPFWLVANKFEAIPNSNSFIVNTAFYKNFTTSNSNFNFSYKVSFTGYSATNNKILINELYGSFTYKNWQLDIGSKRDKIHWKGLSSSNGNIIKSTNTRAFPGINFKTKNYIQLPFAKNWLKVRINFAEYLLNDKRSVNNAQLHHKSLYFKSVFSNTLSLITGLDHYVVWAGTSKIFGKLPSSFKDYLKVITGSSGSSSSLEGEQINALGNSVGAYLIQLNYKGEKVNWNFYYSHPFEDRSGRELSNYPDALYGFFIDLKQPNNLITHILTEFTHTKHMSGSSGISGGDNYFNNSIYSSGWTYFGNTIGSPYFTTKEIDESGITNGVIVGDNRFIAFNIGIKGNFLNTKYKAMLSHTTYFGWFNNEYSQKPKQFSAVVEVLLPKWKNVPFTITMGSAFDTGSYRPNNFGGFLKLTKKGIF